MRRFGRAVDFGSDATRALSQFVAVNARPVRMPSALGLAILGLVLGFSFDRSWLLAAIGAATGFGIGMILIPGPVGIVEQLDRQRRAIGLDQALANDQIAVLEPAARFWEAIDNAMQSTAWRAQRSLASSVSGAALELMRQILVDELRGRSAVGSRAMLREMARRVEAVSAAMGAYSRTDFDSSGVALGEGLPGVAALSDLLAEIEALE